MARNLDLVALRSFVAVADSGGVSMAAERMHLTQSAVSMQIKRLEHELDAQLLQRKGRGVVLTALGEQLLSYARRLIALNDETWARLTNDEFEGEVSLGVPVDLMEPEVPTILKRCKQLYPRVAINLVSALTRDLRAALAKGALDIILTTELALDEGGETLLRESNDWYGAPEGTAHLQRPLPLALCKHCAMRPSVIKALDAAQLAWVSVGDTDNEATVDALVSADLAISPKLRLTTPQVARLQDDRLPVLPGALINLYLADQPDERIPRIAAVVREVFTGKAAAA
ncbi:MAG: LysR family transcriptional regulator [Pseudomonadota bacterium]